MLPNASWGHSASGSCRCLRIPPRPTQLSGLREHVATCRTDRSSLTGSASASATPAWLQPGDGAAGCRPTSPAFLPAFLPACRSGPRTGPRRRRSGSAGRRTDPVLPTLSRVVRRLLQPRSGHHRSPGFPHAGPHGQHHGRPCDRHYHLQ